MAKKPANLFRSVARSYAAYLRHREAWAEKGFGLDRELTLSEYTEAHRDFVHKYGNNHVARKIAQDERTFGAREASAAARKIAEDVKTRRAIVKGDRAKLKELRAQLKELQAQLKELKGEKPSKSIKRHERRLRQRISEQDQKLKEDKAILDERQALKKKYATAKDIYGLQLTKGEIQSTESRRRQKLADRGIDPEFPVQASARGQFFQDLLNAGMTFREARVIYDS